MQLVIPAAFSPFVRSIEEVVLNNVIGVIVTSVIRPIVSREHLIRQSVGRVPDDSGCPSGEFPDKRAFRHSHQNEGAVPADAVLIHESP